MRDGRKVIGSAQRVFGKRLLQHGAIAVHDRRERLARYALRQGPENGAAEASPLEPAAITAERIAASWRAGGAQEASGVLTSRILLASVEYRPQYLDPAWTWRR